jgi:hypothetical protein
MASPPTWNCEPVSRITFPMPRYFFHLEDGERILDRLGQELPDDSAALRLAAGVAAALRRRGRIWRVVVTNEWGHPVTDIP